MSEIAKISFEQALGLGLEGRRFTSREGLTLRRGRIVRTAIEGPMLVLGVDAIELRDKDGEWAPAKAFDYEGHRDDTSVFREANGAISVDIMYIGSIEIAAESTQ